MIRKLLLVAPALLLAGLAVACGDDDEKQISKVFVAPPWPAEESLEYRLARVEDDEDYGTCTIGIRPEDGNTRLEFICTDGTNSDTGTALVEPETLLPLSSNRTVVHPEDNERLSFTSEYDPPRVTFIADENGKTRETERELPEPDDLSPDPGYYDDVSLLWLVRGVELREGAESSFQDVNAGTGQVFRVDLKVEEQERITVPAGDFQTWRVRIRTASITNYYWIEADSPQRLIKARIRGIQDVNYELVRP